MNSASEALADVRGWLCDNLSEGDAGKVCSMLSVVSRHITELKDENAKLDRRRRSLHADVERLGGIIHRQREELSTMQYAIECRNDENAKLRKAAGDAWSLFVRFGAVHPYNLPEVDSVRESLQELEIKVKA